MSAPDLTEALRLVVALGLAPLKRSDNSRPKSHFGSNGAYARWSTARRALEVNVAVDLHKHGATVDFGDPCRFRFGGFSASSTLGLESALRHWVAGAERRIAERRAAK